MEHAEKTPHGEDKSVQTETENTHVLPPSRWRKCWEKISSLHPSWYIVIGLIFLTMSIVIYYEHRESWYFGRGYHGMERMHYERGYDSFPRYFMDIDREFERMDREVWRMRKHMEDRMNMMDSMGQMPTAWTYHSSRFDGRESYMINIQNNDGLTQGTISGTNTGKIQMIKEFLATEKVNLSETGGVMTFSGKINNIQQFQKLIQ